MPLMLVRNKRNWNMTNLPEYWEEYYCALNYQGKFIVMESNDTADIDWMGETEPSRAPIMAMINKNYSLVRETDWRIWEKKE
jgi:hypothetical protein